jgi:hypothetical protein
MKAQRVAPALVCLPWLAGCATPTPVTVDGVSIPPTVLGAVCNHLPVDGHWDGHATLRFDTAGYITGLECTYTVLNEAKFLHDSAWVGIYAPQARPLFDYLRAIP